MSDLSTPQLRADCAEELVERTRGLIPWQTTEALEKCGREEIFRTCKNCGNFKTHFYRCSLKYCPNCNWRISRDRAQLLGCWAGCISQPKHVVLTARNTEHLQSESIARFGKALYRFRRQKFLSSVRGGCSSLEITNEGRGWHLHAHLLLNVPFLPADELAIAWARCIGQEFAIVKVKDVRQGSYLGEIVKYVCKPGQMVKWPPSEIAAFIHAIKGKRFFTTFGSLYDFREVVRAKLNALKPQPTMCACGCGEFRYETEATEIARMQHAKPGRKHTVKVARTISEECSLHI